MIERFALSWTVFVRIPEGIIAEVRCKAASCRVDPLVASGSVADVLEQVGRHVRRHVADFSQVEAWLTGEHAGARGVRP